MKMSNNKPPLVSVIIPCYNNEKTIIETVDSVLKQSFTSIEIIIVNDGSTDETELILNRHIQKISNENIRLISQENQGPSFARNRGALNAAGKYLLFLDGDDAIAPSYIQKCVAILEIHNFINIVYSDAIFFGAQKGIWHLPEFKLPDFLVSNCIYISAMIRTEVFKAVGGFDENLKFAEDWELWLRIIKNYGGVSKIAEKLFFYRKHANKTSLSDNKSNNNDEEKYMLYIYTKHQSFYRENNLGILSLFRQMGQESHTKEKYRHKYYNVWYRKLFYNIKNIFITRNNY
jgi:glycosyltransferase involved in cell wall biosynthesis